MALNMCLSIITLNVTGLNVPTKRHMVNEYKKTRPIYTLPPRHPPQIKRYTQTKSKGMEKDISCNWKKTKTWVAILISNKMDFRTKTIIRKNTI